MKIEQLYTNCLAEAAYYIESNGEAAIIDPLREVEPYLEKLKENNVKLKYIFESHFHADFVSGHVDLAKKTGATIVFGPNATTSYKIKVANDFEDFKIGNITIQVLHTPGHTLESSTFLLKDENGKNHSLFTGDTLFIGDVGRPDLAVKSDLTQEELAGMLFDSLRNKIMPLEDHLLVYPAHGAGSACGKNISKETFSTLGEQKKTNYALQNLTREEFIEELTTGILPAPQYFSKNALMNKQGYEEIEQVLRKANVSFNPQEVAQKVENGALILDVRAPQDFNKAFIPGAINIGLDGQFAVWVGTLIENINQPIILVVPEGREEEAVLRLSRVGYDNTLGYLNGGITAWKNAGFQTHSISSISADELQKRLNDDIIILDVRKPSEFNAEHIDGAKTFPLDFINTGLKNLDKEKTYYIHCKGGYRSMIASSILKKNGFNYLVDIDGGFDVIATNANIPLTDFVCQTSKI